VESAKRLATLKLQDAHVSSACQLESPQKVRVKAVKAREEFSVVIAITPNVRA